AGGHGAVGKGECRIGRRLVVLHPASGILRPIGSEAVAVGIDREAARVLQQLLNAGVVRIAVADCDGGGDAGDGDRGGVAARFPYTVRHRGGAAQAARHRVDRGDPPMNFGTAKAARMPRMTMTTTSSMSVKPRCEERIMYLTPKRRVWNTVI